ncbi:RsiV family protein [Mycolicibacter sp. MYC123]|uniref:RsiV family protein n=1 Tax=[Mycobacterium] zoologicum TaxID=2872311 RepID=A0ABU5YQZ5_9MYCO|nr:RsiV family protein [Mycolicibacter sp. MYC123]MEB3052290.1 RsiV family protein [Mycolicibacter sp. MYC123]
MTALLGTACIVTATLTLSGPARADDDCNGLLGGDWTVDGGQCTALVVSQRNAVMELRVALPHEFVSDPSTRPPIRDYLRDRVESWRTAGDMMVRASDVTITHQTYSHNAIRSVVFHENQQTVGNTANNAFQSFVFDRRTGRQLALADLFKPGVDPLTALPELARPFLADSLDRAQPPHQAGSYPFTPDRFEPRPTGSGFSGDFRAFALTPGELVIFMPDRPMTRENPLPEDQLVWSMDGGTVEAHVPLAALASILRADL